MQTKVKIDKDLVRPWQMDRTKEHASEFRVMWTPGDLLRMFRDAMRDSGNSADADATEYTTIIRAEASAFAGGTQEEDTTHYSVDLLLEGFRRYVKVHFYITHTGNVDTRRLYMYGEGTPRKMWDVETYTLEK